jgi:hypothetical protein
LSEGVVMDRNPQSFPENPTRQMVIDMLLCTYRREAIDMVMGARIAALGGVPDELIAAGEGGRVYAWAVGLADGVMG